MKILSKLQAPAIAGVIREKTAKAAIAEIKNCMYDGADMIASKRIQVEPIISRVESPTEAPRVFNELCDDKNFPIGTVFDWRER